MPHTGYYEEWEGLGIVPYYMWFGGMSNFYFGANFVNHIGHLEDNQMVMVRPINGQHYDSFIFSQYFSTMVDGHYAPIADTLAVIEMIAALPDAANVTFADKAAIEAARAAYNNLPNNAQKSLVDTTRLDAAEMILNSYLEQDTPNENVGDVTEEKDFPVWAIVLISVGGTLVVCAGAFVGFMLWKKGGKVTTKKDSNDKKAKKTSEKKTTAEKTEVETVKKTAEEKTESAPESIENTEE